MLVHWFEETQLLTSSLYQMWESAEKAGIITANLMWPGPPKTMSGASSTYFVPWKVRGELPVKDSFSRIEPPLL